MHIMENDGPNAVVTNTVADTLVLDETAVGTEEDGDSNPAGLATVNFADDLAPLVDHGADRPRTKGYSPGPTVANVAAKPDRLLRRTAAADYVEATYGIPCSPKTLAKLACVSSHGPPFRLAGRFPLYPISGLDAWARAKIGPLVRSTAEAQRAT